MKLEAKLISFVLFLTVFVTNIAYSQVFEEFEVDMEGEEKTEVKVSNILPHLSSWTISEYGAFQDSTKLDTLLDNFQIYHPVFKNSITSSYVGNYGTPALNNDFFNRSSNVDFLFFRSREAYVLTPAAVQY